LFSQPQFLVVGSGIEYALDSFRVNDVQITVLRVRYEINANRD